MTKRLHLISGPRNISTALMYSFGNRSDCSIVDEPLYAHYLLHSEKDHPGRAEVLESQSQDYNQVIQEVFLKEYTTPYVFFKNMAHHIDYMPLNFLEGMHHIFLIRDIKPLIISFDKVYTNPNIQDIGIKREFELFQYVKDQQLPYAILDSGELLKDPKKVLSILCEKLNIPFDEDMLHWEAGPRPEDGSWAKYWYANVHRSTGFSKTVTRSVELSERLVPLYEEALPFYNSLFSLAIKA